MFYKDAIIMLDSIELRCILADMGYRLAIKAKDTYAALLTTKKAVVGLPLKEEYPDGTILTLDSFISGNPQIINCGDNQDLFIAISALSDNHPQLYGWLIDKETNEWVQVTNDNMRVIANNYFKYTIPDEHEIKEKFTN